MTSTSENPSNVTELLEGFDRGNVTSLARAISMVENGRPGFQTLLTTLHPKLGSAYRLGLTGPPGAGKSTLTDQLVGHYREMEETVAVVAVDPTSPLSGGALLGDRIRMESVALDPGVYIRSMAARGAQGGLAITTREVCDVLDAFGFDRIIVETVGVGQSEWDVMGAVDSAVLVLVPESGDGVQVLKAGLMEMVDLYVVNKSDRQGSNQLSTQLREMLEIRIEKRRSDEEGTRVEWDPVVLETVATNGTGIAELTEALEQHANAIRNSAAGPQKRRDRILEHTRNVVERTLRQRTWSVTDGERVLLDGLDRVMLGELSPYQLADLVLEAVLSDADFRRTP